MINEGSVNSTYVGSLIQYHNCVKFVGFLNDNYFCVQTITLRLGVQNLLSLQRDFGHQKNFDVKKKLCLIIQLSIKTNPHYTSFLVLFLAIIIQKAANILKTQSTQVFLKNEDPQKINSFHSHSIYTQKNLNITLLGSCLSLMTSVNKYLKGVLISIFEQHYDVKGDKC